MNTSPTRNVHETSKFVKTAMTANALVDVSPAKLDSLDLSDLLATVRNSGDKYSACAPQDSDLDRVYLIKVARLLMTVSSTTADIAPLAAHLSKVRALWRVGNTSLERQVLLERLNVFIDLLDVAGDFIFERSQTEVSSHGKKNWETVAGILLLHKGTGVSWGQLAAKVMQSDDGPSSKGGVSQLVTSMRAAGWLEATSHGREKMIHPGPNIHLSATWQKAFPGEGQTDLELRTSSGQALPSFAAYSQAISIVQKTICGNQTKIIETFYLASEKHRLLKESDAEPDVRIGLRNNLLNFLNVELVNTVTENFEHLRKYFKLRGSQPPRMCIKGNWSDGKEQQLIVDVIRDRLSDVSNESCRLEDNTGFLRVKESGCEVLINDIPKAALTEGYKNPRLNTSRLERLAMSKTLYGSAAPLISQEEWISCWTLGAEGTPGGWYRSTLIIPITLVNNELSSEFVNSLDKRIEHTKLPGIRRIILGYLCLDHEEADYFDATTDVSVGYMFADILSIYLFMRYVYTQLSTTIRGLEQCEITANETLLAAQRNRQPRFEQIGEDLEPRKNLLLSVDEGIFAHPGRALVTN